jgi:hypothetical protein
MNEREVLQIFGEGVPGTSPPIIESLDDWFTFAPPKGGAKHWVPLRSAYELADAWCGTGKATPPSEFLRMLASHPSLEGLKLVEGYAEHKTALRGERGGPRNHDLLLVGKCVSGPVVIGVEGKADETFDREIAERWATASAEIAAGKNTGWPARLSRLTRALLGCDAFVAPSELNPQIAKIPYQLLSAVAGTLIEAQEHGATVAALVAHVFTSSATSTDKVLVNAKAFADFVRRVSAGGVTDVKDGVLYGPFRVPGGAETRIPSQIDLLLGKVTTSLDA